MKRYWFVEIIIGLYEFGKDILAKLFATNHVNQPFPEMPEPIPYSIPDPIPQEVVKSNREKLYDVAKNELAPAHDVSPKDIAPDEYGCVESFDNIHKLTFGKFINGTTNIPTVSTIIAYEIFTKNPLIWQKITNPEPGDIAICVTQGKKIGHIGVWGKYRVMSNRSKDGIWSDSYTHKRWFEYYGKEIGLKTYFFRKI